MEMVSRGQKDTLEWVLNRSCSWACLTVSLLPLAELLGQATLPVGSPSKPLSRRQVCPLTPGPGKSLSPAAIVTVEVRRQPLWGDGWT